MTPETVLAQQEAAHTLWVELSTRIATQRLPFRSGDEEAAAKSVFDLFGITRKLMTDNPGAADFLTLGNQMLNQTIRPYTARWHEWMTADAKERDQDGKPALKFRDAWVRKQFRRELRALQPHLVGCLKALEAMKGGAKGEAWWTAPEKTPEQLQELREWCGEPNRAELGRSLPAGIVADQIRFKGYGPDQQQALVAKINNAEAGEIRRRRGTADAAPFNDAAALAFSGGGIRSATFCLGIAQVLARRGLFSQFDYLSTVSGGGYLGSFLSAVLGTGDRLTPAQPDSTAAQREAAARLHTVLDAPVPGAPPTPEPPREPVPLRHLRNHSRYLAEGGFKRQLIGVGIVLAGVLFNLLILLLVPLTLALATFALDAANLLPVARWATDPVHWLPLTGWWGYLVAAVLALTAAAALIYPRVKSWSEQGCGGVLRAWETLFVPAVVASAVLVAVCVVPLCFRLYDFILSAQFWPAIEALRAKLEGLAAVLGLSLTAIFTTLSAKVKPKGSLGSGVRVVAMICPPLLCLYVYLAVGHRLILTAPADQWPWWSVLTVTVLLAIWAFFLVDVNTYSPHGYYRDRLSDCYLRTLTTANPANVATPEFAMKPTDGLKLQQLNQHVAAPYHLINTTLNIPNSTEREVRGRNADFFLFSKHYCGSPLTGYHPTADLEAADSHLNLGTAMAISGAAASSNMGWKTMNSFRVVMTLANVRLGYWLRNPILGATATQRMGGPSSRYLYREMFARKMDETQPYLNLSDGGHYENLAAYELLRRRCKFIVCIDGGCEPDMQCTDLLRLERYAAIDLGIKMHYDLSDLFLQENGFSRAYGVLVKIDYNPPKTESERRARDPKDAEWGWMLYLKLAMVGYGPGYVMDYKRTHPVFPHESTADQIYDEEQFEAYRALGEAAAETFFVPELTESANVATVRGWFQALANTLLPDNDEAMLRTPVAHPAGTAP